MSEQISSWLAGRLPDEWFQAAPEVTVDRDEIVVVGRLPDVEGAAVDGDGDAQGGRIARYFLGSN